MSKVDTISIKEKILQIDPKRWWGDDFDVRFFLISKLNKINKTYARIVQGGKNQGNLEILWRTEYLYLGEGEYKSYDLRIEFSSIERKSLYDDAEFIWDNDKEEWFVNVKGFGSSNLISLLVVQKRRFTNQEIKDRAKELEGQGKDVEIKDNEIKLETKVIIRKGLKIQKKQKKKEWVIYDYKDNPWLNPIYPIGDLKAYKEKYDYLKSYCN